MLQKGCYLGRRPLPKYHLLFMMGIMAEVTSGRGRVHVLYLLIISSALAPVSAVFITLGFGWVSHYYRDEDIPALDPVNVSYY